MTCGSAVSADTAGSVAVAELQNFRFSQLVAMHIGFGSVVVQVRK